jgi:hypothetical protein
MARPFAALVDPYGAVIDLRAPPFIVKGRYARVSPGVVGYRPDLTLC